MGGLDDANDGPGECPGHVWRMNGVSFDDWGLWRSYRCINCEGALVANPDEEEPYDGGRLIW